MTTIIFQTEHVRLKLSTTGTVTDAELDRAYAAFQAMRDSLVTDPPAMTQEEAEEQIARLKVLAEPQGAPSHEAPSLWVMKKRPTPEQILGRRTFMGPLDSSHMGLRLRDGDKAVLTPAHENVHADAMHRWVEEFVGSPNYVCSHGGCWATVEVTTA